MLLNVATLYTRRAGCQQYLNHIMLLIRCCWLAGLPTFSATPCRWRYARCHAATVVAVIVQVCVKIRRERTATNGCPALVIVAMKLLLPRHENLAYTLSIPVIIYAVCSPYGSIRFQRYTYGHTMSEAPRLRYYSYGYYG